ncbi:hypothetical protein GGS20DRAFT_206138 [Poronia punctata]|nr:hypothetical protein GGS20DRAFT_206138 [Poronia punctata]
MNRFRTKKKGKDEEASSRPSHDSESSMPFRGFRKGKKTQEDEKKPIDLASALPSNDDFRTSLLMTGLSARFSMLREQDDPSTKIGKASDDSVLFPKRQSRLDITSSYRGLGDIAEVESIKAASPFARLDAYNSDDADSLRSGSVMTRAKPTEGNNLFGGRQKIYKIPANGTSKAADGGMGGRALYEDDVAQSAFQKWRRAERERDLSQDESDGEGTDGQYNSRDRLSSTDIEPRSVSPAPSGYSRKRETSSTMSSIPSMARNSSAATSITSSQPTPSLKDWQPPLAPNSGPERTVTRTRRLYETGFFNHEAQESAPGLSRIDTLNRQRPFGARTPEASQQSPALSASSGFIGRLSGEKKLLAKGSAPNLRSVSPPAIAPATRTPDLGIRVPSGGEGKSGFGAAPPLSPAISEAEENSILAINPNDRGKATALGVFQKPAQPYDESRYAQRQLQLQRGRETPTQQRRSNEVNTPTSRRPSESPTSTRKQMMDSPTAPTFEVTQSTPRNRGEATSFLADPEGSETSSLASPKPLPSPQLHLRRPSDREHPAFRDPSVPTPLSLVTEPHDEMSLQVEKQSSLKVESAGISPADSPTLGPGTDGPGLSGMVRQHLRGVSNASSFYEGALPTAGLESRFPAEAANAKAMQDYGAGSNPWDSEDHGHDWNLDLDVNEPLADGESFVSDSAPTMDGDASLRSTREEGNDQFAYQLADGARRVRERLTSFVETDSRSSSPQRIVEPKDSADPTVFQRPSGLGSILRPRSSKGSLIDRGREPSTRAFKMVGISPGASRTGSPAGDSLKRQSDVDGESGREKVLNKGASPGEGDQHAGVRAFRQAKRDLQKLKEIDTQQRYHPAPQGPPPGIPSSRPRTRTPSGDGQPPHGYPRQRIPSEESRTGDALSTSRMSPRMDRQRSESNTSNGTRSNSRLGRPGEGLNGSNSRLASRSPGLPGTDTKQSMVMPSHAHPNATRINQSNFASNTLQAPRGYETDQPSPISPGASLIGSTPATPTNSSPSQSLPAEGLGPESPTAPIPSMGDSRRKVRARDISEPKLIMSTSRVPTVALPTEAEGNRSRSNSRSAPPVPPINPRRRQDSTKVRAMLDSFTRLKRESNDRENMSAPNSSLDEAASRSQDGSGTDPRRPQRTARGDSPIGANLGQPRMNSQPVNIGPPASRMVVTQGRNRPENANLPGGMI